MQIQNDSELKYWIGSQESRTVLKEVHQRIDELVTELARGDLSSFNSEQLARKYHEVIGEIKGLQYVEKSIEDYKEAAQRQIEERDNDSPEF